MGHTSHRISIPSILEVGPNQLSLLGFLLKKQGFKNVVVCFGEGIKELVGNVVFESLRDERITCCKVLEINTINIEDIIKLTFSIPHDTEVILGIGGGKAIDASKYISFIKKLPFISIPTSTSNDSFSSSGVSLLFQGKRVSLHAKMPYGIICDINILKSAPDKFIYSGIGDLLSNVTAINDWKFEERHNKTIVNDFSIMISSKAINSFINTTFDSIKNDHFLLELVDSLTLNGIAMEIAGVSAPASGSEHLISHALDEFTNMNQLHGIQVGLSTYVMSKIQNHRFNEITQVLTTTGFFDYVKTLNLNKEDLLKAIDYAPSIKPNRYTYIHMKENQGEAKRFILEDSIINSILK